jgi:phospholipid-transporting ATPase
LSLAVAFGVLGALSADASVLYLRLDAWGQSFVLYTLRFLLLFSIFIPISLYVTVTVVKLLLSVFIPEGRANNTSVIDDLGCCSVVCCDKTGTITKFVILFVVLFCCLCSLLAGT